MRAKTIAVVTTDRCAFMCYVKGHCDGTGNPLVTKGQHNLETEGVLFIWTSEPVHVAGALVDEVAILPGASVSAQQAAHAATRPAS